MRDKTISDSVRLCWSFFVVFCLSDVAPVNAQRRGPPPCGPNHTIPAGYQTCKEADGRVFIGPPPPAAPSKNPEVVVPHAVVVPPPPARPHADRSVAPAQPSTNQSQSQPRPQQSEERSFWTNVAWITAIAGLVAALAQLIRSLRKNG
jgi:hypothetical protein